MAAVNKTKNQKDAPKTFRIRYKDGQEDYVGAHSFSYHPKQGDLIKFYDETPPKLTTCFSARQRSRA